MTTGSTAPPLDLFGHELPASTTTRWTALFSASSDEWPTDQAVVDEMARRYGRFTLDVAATAASAKAPRFYTLADNALLQRWHLDAAGGPAWCNPPYSIAGDFVRKADDEAAHGLTTVLLLPARTDRPWFHLALERQAAGVADILFARGRLRFGGVAGSAPFPSIVIVMRGRP